MDQLIARLKREPIVTRAGLAAVLNVLVVAGVIDTGAAESVEAAVLALVTTVALFSARGKVTPLVNVTPSVHLPAILADTVERASKGER